MFNNLFNFDFVSTAPVLAGGAILLGCAGYYLTSYFIKDSVILLDAGTQTTVNSLTDAQIQTLNVTLNDANVQTSQFLLEKHIEELILNGWDTNTSTRMTTDFVNRYRDNPEFAEYFNHEDTTVNNWLDSIDNNVSPISSGSGNTTLSQINKEIAMITRLKDNLKVLSNPSSVANSPTDPNAVHHRFIT